MNLGELMTASQHHTPVKLIVVDNSSLAMEENRAIVTGLNTEGMKLVNPDFAGVAHACGWDGIRVEEYGKLEEAIKICMDSNKPYLLDVACAKPVAPHTKI
jgi:thiamine pyrophosphate-dependent acetolactate synthase large subunit-like protein